MESFWKKSILVCSLSILSSGVSAQDLQQKVQKKLDRIERIKSRIQSNIYSMSNQELRSTNQKLKQAITVLNSGGGNDPYPPTPRPPRDSVSVSGNIESFSFMYDVTDAMDLALKCESQFKGRIGNADDAAVSVDFSPMQKYSTTGWWTGAGAACGKLADKAVKMGLAPKRSYDYAAVGSIEGKSYSFSASSLREVMSQCNSFYNRNGLGNVDDLSVFNGTKYVVKSTTGWWSSANEVCNVIIQQVRN